MRLYKGTYMNGFRLLDEQKVEEINSIARIYAHERTGARLLWLDNDDDNKVFSIAFRTPTRDDTGIAHILEHSVLAGSRKYPLKEPFVELIKGSLNTFVNAMTFPDKTVYPVASRNDKDFFNLVDVYLDAVFNPAIAHEQRIFMQEGWHYELDKPEGELKLNGVVYNEMKGAFSSPESVVEHEIYKTLFPEGSYGKDSGGHPDSIPELKYSQFCKFHAKYYHPSNAWIYIYGNVDAHAITEHIDREYLANYDCKDINSTVKLQQRCVEERLQHSYYPVGRDVDLEDKTFLTYNFQVGCSSDVQLTMAMKALEAILLESPASPLRRALTEAGIGQEICGDFESMIAQPVFSIKAINANAKDAHAFRRIIMDTLTRLVECGIDKKLIESMLNRKEFALREADFGSYPKGLIYNIAVLETWLYGGNPLDALKYEQYLPALRAGVASNYFEQLIREHLLDNMHRALVIVEPEAGLDEVHNQAERARLAEYKAGLNSEQLLEIIDNAQDLKQWQERVDSEEDLCKIPVLSRADLTAHAEKYPLEVRDIAGREVIFSNIFTNKIIHCGLLFDMSVIDPDDLEYMHLLLALLGKIDTQARDYGDLSAEINLHTGGFTLNSAFLSDYNESAGLLPLISVRFKALRDSFGSALHVAEEIITASTFTNKKRLKEIVQELHAEMEMSLVEDGCGLATATIMGNLTSAGVYQARGLYPFYLFVRRLDRNYDALYEEVAQRLTDIMQRLFTARALRLHLICDDGDYNCAAEYLSDMVECLAAGVDVRYSYNEQPVATNYGLVIPSKVQYVLKGLNYLEHGCKFSGSMKVLDTILSYDYLWNKVRVQGGAYGAFARFLPHGAMYLGSYRDPNLKSSLDVYDATTEYLEKFEVSDREMLKYLIGTLSRVDMPLTPFQKGQTALHDYLTGRTHSDVQRERNELLATDQRAIREYATLFRQMSAANILCVVGGKEMVESNRGLFNNITEIIQ